MSVCVCVCFPSQAVVQCEQVRSELARQRERLEQELEAQQQRIAQARDSARHQANKEKEELAQTVKLTHTHTSHTHRRRGFVNWTNRIPHTWECIYNCRPQLLPVVCLETDSIHGAC